jgi:hypothetical protein
LPKPLSDVLSLWIFGQERIRERAFGDADAQLPIGLELLLFVELIDRRLVRKVRVGIW